MVIKMTDFIADIGFFHTCQTRFGEAYRRLFGDAAHEAQLSLPEATVLIFFANNPDLDTASDAVNLRGLSKAYVSKAVEPLVERGYLAVCTDPSDRRYQHLRPTPAAADAIALLQSAQKQFISLISAGITDEEKATMAAIMQKIKKNAESLPR